MKSKAIFLLVIFLLNTIVGLGCKPHLHHHQHAQGLNLSKEDLCCKTLVNDLVTQGKLLPEAGKLLIKTPVLWIQGYTFFMLLSPVSFNILQIEYPDARDRPPERDIRITIQSFQI